VTARGATPCCGRIKKTCVAQLFETQRVTDGGPARKPCVPARSDSLHAIGCANWKCKWITEFAAAFAEERADVRYSVFSK
jgi:hypothetical protein